MLRPVWQAAASQRSWGRVTASRNPGLPALPRTARRSGAAMGLGGALTVALLVPMPSGPARAGSPQPSHPFAVVAEKRGAPQPHPAVTRQLIPPAPAAAPLGPPPAPRPPLGIETDLLPLGSAPAAPPATKPAG
jgi:hypothetical protein